MQQQIHQYYTPISSGYDIYLSIYLAFLDSRRTFHISKSPHQELNNSIERGGDEWRREKERSEREKDGEETKHKIISSWVSHFL